MALRVRVVRNFRWVNMGNISMKTYAGFSREMIQQAFVSSEGDTEWRDLEVIQEEEEITD